MHILIMDLQGRVEAVPYPGELRWKNTIVCSKFLQDTLCHISSELVELHRCDKSILAIFTVHNVDLWLLHKYCFNVCSVFIA